MIIGIDGNEANVSKRVGIGEYAFELLKQFEKFKIQNLKFKIYLKDSPLKDLPGERDGWTYRVVGPRKFWTQIGLPLDLFVNRPRPDVFFTPTHYAPRFSPVPSAISVMDLSYIHFPDLFRRQDLYQLRNWTRYSVRKAQKIFTISKASKDDIIKTYGVSPDKIVVTYPGIKMQTQNINQKTKGLKILKKYGIEKEYILFVGTLQPRKNVEKLIEAFSLVLKKSRKDILLVIVGKKGWLYEDILSAPSRYGISDNVIFLDFVTDEDLKVLYQQALCFVLPSLYEGFGLPVLEAMTNNCPVIISNVSSLPEAGGDAALYVDPNNTDDIAEKIHLLVNDSTLREKLIDKGKMQVKKFSWEKAAQQTLSVLKRL